MNELNIVGACIVANSTFLPDHFPKVSRIQKTGQLQFNNLPQMSHLKAFSTSASYR